MVDSLYSWSEIRWTAPNKSTSWQKAEEYIREKYDLIEDHDAWHDARDENGNPYEIKSCAYQAKSPGLQNQ